MKDKKNKKYPKSYKIKNVLNKLNLKKYQILGNPDMEFSIASTIWDGKKGSITFCSKKKISEPIVTINASKASVIIVEQSIDVKQVILDDKAVVLVDNPRGVFIKILNICFGSVKKRGGIHRSSHIDEKVDLHASVYIGPLCVIGRCKIKSDTVIHPNVIINDNVTIGRNVVIGPGCVIGYDGYGYNRDEKGNLEKFPHYGGVVIEDDVEIGSNVSIDRGTLGDTVIKKGAKIDNFCHIAHNVIIGRHTQIIAHAMLGGSAEIGNYAWVAPSAALREGVKVGDNALVGLGAVVTKNVPDNTVVIGNPAIPFEVFKKNQKILKKFLQKFQK